MTGEGGPGVVGPTVTAQQSKITNRDITTYANIDTSIRSIIAAIRRHFLDRPQDWLSDADSPAYSTMAELNRGHFAEVVRIDATGDWLQYGRVMMGATIRHARRANGVDAEFLRMHLHHYQGKHHAFLEGAGSNPPLSDEVSVLARLKSVKQVVTEGTWVADADEDGLIFAEAIRRVFTSGVLERINKHTNYDNLPTYEDEAFVDGEPIRDIDELGPNLAVDGLLRRLRMSQKTIEHERERMQTTVNALRELQVPWAVIGETLGVTGPTVRQRFTPEVREAHRQKLRRQRQGSRNTSTDE